VPLARFRTKVYYWEHGKFPAVKRNFLPTLCMQCEDTPCLKACDSNAIVRGADGIVRVIADARLPVHMRRSVAMTMTLQTNAIFVRIG
jgi:nitrate reductase beta subunit